jgi:RNA polymerase sigma factor (sigma-70 family)
MSFSDSSQARWFEEQVQPHEAMMRAWLHSRFPDLGDADDVIQEAYVRVLQAHERGELQYPKAFLFATARNLVLDQLRRQKIARFEPLVETDALSVLDESGDTVETVAANQELALLTEAIQLLPDRCRQIFTLRKIYGLSQKEIAQRLEISEHTVSAQLSIGVHKCTEFFRARRIERK